MDKNELATKDTSLRWMQLCLCVGGRSPRIHYHLLECAARRAFYVESLSLRRADIICDQDLTTTRSFIFFAARFFSIPSDSNQAKMDTAYQSYKVLSKIGKSPFDGPNEVGGEETDSVVTKVTIGVFGIVAITAIVSGGE